MRRLPLLILIALIATPAKAQAPVPARLQIVSDLAYAMGQSHALRQNCRGEGDQYWRGRMQHILNVEAPDEAGRVALADAFNNGFRDARGRHAACNPDSRAAERLAAANGRSLALLLSRATVPKAPVSVAPPTGSR